MYTATCITLSVAGVLPNAGVQRSAYTAVKCCTKYQGRVSSFNYQSADNRENTTKMLSMEGSGNFAKVSLHTSTTLPEITRERLRPWNRFGTGTTRVVCVSTLADLPSTKIVNRNTLKFSLLKHVLIYHKIFCQ